MLSIFSSCIYFLSLVDARPAEIASLFQQSVPDDTKEKTTAADDFNTPVIVLIVIAAVLLLALIIAAVLIARARKRYSYSVDTI